MSQDPNASAKTSGNAPGPDRRNGGKPMNQRVSLLTEPKSDFLASLVVFLVALPLCMGIAIASGVDPARGLMTGIIGGLVVGFLGGSPLSVSGPAAGLTVIVFDFLNEQREGYLASHAIAEGATETARSTLEAEAFQHAILALGAAVFLAGAMQLVAGIFKLGQWFRAVSPAVIRGMLAGIGVLIFSSQFHVMVDDTPAASGVTNLLTIPRAVYKGLVPLDGSTHHLAAATGALTIIVILLWSRFAPQRVRMIPAPLVAVIVATIFAMVTQLNVINVEVPTNMLERVALPTTESLPLLLQAPVIVAAIVLAVVASAETLLCATAVDQLHSGPRTNYDRELFGQGAGNMLCGLVGALPMTAVIVRSSANVQAGAKSPLSAILHGIWLLAFVAVLPGLLNYVPRACLGAILVYTGYRLMDPAAVRKLWKYGKSEVAIYAATVAVIVIEDLLTGILVGLGLSAAKLLYRFSHLSIALEHDETKRQAILHLEGAATFIRLPSLAAELEKLPPDYELRVDIQRLTYIDHACLDLLMNWAKQHEATGGTLVIDWASLHANFYRKPRANDVSRSEETAGAAS